MSLVSQAAPGAQGKLTSSESTVKFDHTKETAQAGNNGTTQKIAQANPSASTNSEAELLDQINNYSNGEGNSLNQVNSVFQLRDVSPDDWAFEALRNLVERYGCIAGYPDGTFRGDRAMTRYEFAAGLNACLQQIERLIADQKSKVSQEDLATLQRLTEEFEAELSTLGTRVDNLEGRVAVLEDNQFSTTTKLSAEVVFAFTDTFRSENDDTNTVFQHRGRLDFVSSFTGRDALHARLDFSNASPLLEGDGLSGATTFQTADTGNNVELGWLAYYFPIGERIQVYLPAAFPLWQDFAPTISPYFEGFTGANNAISSFAESSPIYKIGLPSGGGLGANYNIAGDLNLSLGYFGGETDNPDNGLFNGDYAALGQLAWDGPRFKLAFTYVNAYQEDGTIFDLGVGTTGAAMGEGAAQPFNGAPTMSNSYGIEGSIRLSDGLVVNGYGGFTDARQLAEGEGDAEIWYYALGLAFPDLGKEGNLGGLLVGSEPYIGSAENPDRREDTAVHVEGFYRFQMNDNISITPGLIWLPSPEGGDSNNDAFIGTLRTTFTF
ncbi:MAG: hypothetical protein BRC33_06560 [Cyanobacteria bacterium SW_9_44_58]|nr:MAG: hypothetical protein BRC33_06560 [Cyanobacteria bacterium SW_9_44_58]